MMEEKMIEVGMYADQTGLFSESELYFDNSVEFLLPEWIVKKWFDENDLGAEAGDDGEDITFEQWLNEVYTYDGTDGLYQFALDNGVKPTFGVEGHHYVFWRDDDNFKSIVFEGSYDKCREFMKENNFIWRDEYELEVK